MQPILFYFMYMVIELKILQIYFLLLITIEEAFGLTKIFLRNENIIQLKKITAKIIQLKKFKPENVGNSDNTY